LLTVAEKADAMDSMLAYLSVMCLDGMMVYELGYRKECSLAEKWVTFLVVKKELDKVES
jgi:hypothetical protein